MRVGIGTYTYAWAIGIPGQEPAQPMTATDLIRRGSELGVEVVQICDNLPLHQASAAQRAQLRDCAAECGISIQLGTRGSRVQHLRRYLELAVEFASPILRVVVDSPGDEPEPQALVQRLCEVLPECEENAIGLAIENHDRFATGTLLGILEAVDNPHLGICLDTVNSFGALEGPDVVLNALLPHTISLHVKDFAIRRHSHQMGFEIEGMPAGEGRLDIPTILSRVEAANPQADAILELWTPPAGDIDATVAKEAAWAERSIAYLQRQLTRNRGGSR